MLMMTQGNAVRTRSENRLLPNDNAQKMVEIRRTTSDNARVRLVGLACTTPQEHKADVYAPGRLCTWCAYESAEEAGGKCYSCIIYDVVVSLL